MSRARPGVLPAVGLVFLACGNPSASPTIRIFEDCIYADFSRSDEDYRSLTEITLRDEDTGEVVWRAEAAGAPVPRVFELKLCLGWNPILPEMIGSRRRFTFTIPAGGDRFFLEHGKAYVLEARTDSPPAWLRETFRAP